MARKTLEEAEKNIHETLNEFQQEIDRTLDNLYPEILTEYEKQQLEEFEIELYESVAAIIQEMDEQQ